ncbi:MAG: nuclear transport factor 2 family protein [Candidatus Polarisedimenticolia bacterium]
MRATLATLLMVSAQFTSAGAESPAHPAQQVVSGQTTISLPDTSAYSPTARRLLDLEVERSAAIARHDTAWLSTLYAPDFRGVPANGQLVDRAALLQVFGRDNPDSRFLIDELVVNDYGTSATVMGRLRTTTLSGDVVAESRYLHVYQSRDQHWWIVAAIGSAVRQ